VNVGLGLGLIFVHFPDLA